MADYQYVRSELSAMLPSYTIIADCIKMQVKDKGIAYLPDFLPTDDPIADKRRYEAYRTRAVFYDVTGRTLEGLQGQIFSKKPVVETPTLLDPVVKDANGDGVSLEGLAQLAVANTIAYGRCGLFVDYPAVEGGATVGDLQRGSVRPTILLYEAGSIINWRYAKRGGKKILSLVVLKEKRDTGEDNSYDSESKEQYRIVKLVNGACTVEIRGEKPKGAPKANDPVQTAGNQIEDDLLDGPFIMRDKDGKPLDEIPFTFIGAVNNSADFDKPPLLALANLNIAHYRNSADYEESCFITGQPTLVVNGLTAEWATKILKGKLQMGARAGIPLPTGSTAEILQVSENTMAFQAMEHKERQMVALGAKLVEQKQVQRTATEAGIENAAETSVLSTIAKNVSAAVKWCLEWCALMVIGTESGIEFQLNSDFEISRMSAQQRQQLISEWQANAITFSEMRAALRKNGVATLSDDEAEKELQKAQEDDLNIAAKEATALAKAAAAGNPDNGNGNVD